MIIFLYGDDPFRSREKLSQIKNKFLEKSGPGSVPAVLDFEEKAGNELEKAISSGGLFSPKQLVIVKNLLSAGSSDEQKNVLDFLKSASKLKESCDLVLVFWEGGFPKKSELFKFLEKNFQKQNFEKLAGVKLNSWIVKRIREINPRVSFSRQALERLVACSGDDLRQINNELEKLAGFKESGKITEKDVDLLATSKISSTIFETIEAASGGNKKRALGLLHRQLENQEDPFYILSMYVYQFRNLLKIGEYYRRETGNKFDIAKKTGLHPYVVQKSFAQIQNFTLEKLKNIFARIQKIDLESKTGKIDINLALDKFLAEL